MLGPIVETLGKNAPEIVLSIREELSGPLSEMVTNGIVDLAVGVDMFMNDSVTFTPLTQDPMVGVFHPDEPLLANDSISWRDVAQLPFISFAQSSIEHGVAEAFAEAQVRLQPRFEVKFAATAVSLVLAKAGFAVLPNLALKLVNLDGVVIRPILPTVQRNVGILVHSYHSLSPAAAFIRDSILGAASKLTS
jgi:DNA-binding transcriptional LysR family regulator